MVGQGCAVRFLRGGQALLQGEQGIFENAFQFGHGLFPHYFPGFPFVRHEARKLEFPACREQQVILV